MKKLSVEDLFSPLRGSFNNVSQNDIIVRSLHASEQFNNIAL